MPELNSATMTQARFAALVEAYGGDPARWPLNERRSAERWLATTPAAQLLVSQARDLDRALGAKTQAIASTALEARLLEDFERANRRSSLHEHVAAVAQMIWPGVPAWQPAFLLGIAFAVGLCIAAFAPLDVPLPDDRVGAIFVLDDVPDAGQGI